MDYSFQYAPLTSAGSNPSPLNWFQIADVIHTTPPVREILGHPPFGVRRYATRSYATARGLQLPICSLDLRWQKPIAAQQVPDSHCKPNETAHASPELIRPSEFHRFLNSVIKAHHHMQSKAARWPWLCYLGGWLKGRGGITASPYRYCSVPESGVSRWR